MKKRMLRIWNLLLCLCLTAAMAFITMFTLPPITAYAVNDPPSMYAFVNTYEEFVGAVTNTNVTNISVRNDFSLEGNVTIDRPLTIISDSAYTINADTHSLIIANGGDVTLIGNFSLTGASTTVEVSSGGALSILVSYTGTISTTGANGKALYAWGNASVDIRGGTITAPDGAYSVYLDDAKISVTASSALHLGKVYFHFVWTGDDPADLDVLIMNGLPEPVARPITVNVGEEWTVSPSVFEQDSVWLSSYIDSDAELNVGYDGGYLKMSPATPGNFKLILNIATADQSNVDIIVPVSVVSGFAGGSGTSANPWQIETAAELDNVRKYLGDQNSNKFFELINDIDLTDYLSSGGDGYNNGEGWVPIGGESQFDGSPFTGHFNGGGHTISGLYSDSGGNYTGLFGVTSGAAIQNLQLANIDLTGNTVGGLAGYSFNSSLTGCCVTGTVNGESPSGGLVGILYGGSVSDCYAIVDVSAVNSPGGLAGGLSNGGTINNCYAAGTVPITASCPDIGGLVGVTYGGIAVIVNSSYYNCQTSGQSDNDGRGEPKSSSEMVRQATYSGWDFTSVWAINEGVSYPYLQALVPASLPAPPAAVSARIVGDPGDSQYNASTKTLTMTYGDVGASFSAGDVTPADGLVILSSSNEAVADTDWDINGNITIEAEGAGTATISLKSVNGDTLDSITVVVEPIPLLITGDLEVEDKEYDGSANADIAATSTLSLDTAGCINGDAANLTANFAATFSDPDAGQDKAVSLNTSTLTGPAAGNYVLDFDSAPATTATISRKELTIGGSFTAQNKAYDGTTNAAIASNNLTLVGKIGSDDVTLVAVLAFDTPDIATGKAVSLTTDSSLTGAKAGNYTLSFTGAPTYTSGVITDKQATLGGSFTVNNKVYSGDKAATIAVNNLTLAGVLSGDDVSIASVTAEFDSAGVGDGQTVRITGVTLAGANAGNYAVSLTGAPTATADITAKPLTITGSFTVQNRQYNGTVNAVIDTNNLTMNGIIGSDTVSLNASAAFDNANAGTAKPVTLTGSTLAGADAANYILDFTGAPVTAADISKATELQAPASPTLQSKTSTSVTLTPNAEQEFSKDNGTTWQTSNVFTGLTPSTEYSFITRIKDDANHEASPASAALTVRTDAPSSPGGSSSGGGSTSSNGSTSSAGNLEIPTSLLSDPNSGKTLALGNDFANVTIPSDMLDSIPGVAGKKAEISIGQGDKSKLSDDVKVAIGDRPLISLSLLIDGKQTDWSNPDAPATVSIPYKPTADELRNPDGIVVWYIDGSGNPQCVTNGHYDPATGNVTFDVTHFSDYAVVYNPASFNDVKSGAWYFKPVSFIAAREITTGTGDGNFSPGAKLTRGQFLVMLMKAYGIAPNSNLKDNFTDAGNNYYTGYLAEAKRQGISAGVGGNLFAPAREITRQEMFTLLYNALKVIGQLPQGDSGKTLSDFSDADQISLWAKDAMALLTKTGTIAGSGEKINPTGTATRAEMAQVIYHLLTE